MRRRPPTDSAIWTAVAPEAVRTRLILAIPTILSAEISALNGTNGWYHSWSKGFRMLDVVQVTQLRFEAEKEDGLRKVGYSKERRVNPQTVVGLLVDRTGFPLEIG